MTAPASAGERRGPWFCGPPGKRRTYRVDDVDGIRGGQGLVVRARRATFPGDPVGWAGTTSLKLTAGDDRPDLAVMRARWAQLATIRHPSLARALEVFEGPGLFTGEAPPDGDDDVLYQAAEWVEGASLRDVAPLPPAAVAVLARDLAGGLAALHGAGLVHRDIHPGNVVISDDGRAVLIDLGSVRPDDGGATITVAGALGFIAPEALHGDDGRAAADCWGLGMTTVYALLGRAQGAMSRPRLRSELVAALAGTARPRAAAGRIERMVAPDPGDRPDDPARWAAQLHRCLAPRRAGHRRLVAGLVAVAAGLVLAVGAIVTTGRAGDASATAAPSAPSTVGGFVCRPVVAAGGGPSPELAAAVERLVPGACVGGKPDGFAEAQVEPIAKTDGTPLGVVVISPDNPAVHLTPAEWASYRELVGKGHPENSAAFAGYPTGVKRGVNLVRVYLGSGGFLLGRRDDTQLFWVPTVVLGLWRRHGSVTGDLGLPTSNPYPDNGEIRLDFEGGYMRARTDDLDDLLAGNIGPGTVSATVVEARAAALGTPPPRQAIVRQSGGTAWWVDRQGRRHWIQDGDTWACLGGDDAVAGDDVPGWAVASLPLGVPARCP